MKMCVVPNCPAESAKGRLTCAAHRLARTAKELHIAKDVEGRGGKRCVACRRTFSEGDYVLRQVVEKKRAKPGAEAFGWQHVACEPSTARLSKRQIRESEKPLLAVAD